MRNLVPIERIESKIFLIRGQKVMLDKDLAELYRVPTKQLKRQIRRNIRRFPIDFMFRLTKTEQVSLRCQIGTFKKGEHSKYLPFAFTDQGVAMLSSVLNSKRAIFVNIQIIRTFTKLRQMLASHKELREKIEIMERKYDKQFRVVFEYIKSLLDDDKSKKTKIGFNRQGKEELEELKVGEEKRGNRGKMYKMWYARKKCQRTHLSLQLLLTPSSSASYPSFPLAF